MSIEKWSTVIIKKWSTYSKKTNHILPLPEGKGIFTYISALKFIFNWIVSLTKLKLVNDDVLIFSFTNTLYKKRWQISHLFNLLIYFQSFLPHILHPSKLLFRLVDGIHF